eukprot:CAMPEP_0181216624 /NCGR_PEP_ID=MMETSP1096-20121128/26694_1 /TAXON_ID=156174 ORGANISM="Chrysochromulina ericina, Strain CCMP281" /NCGR_SAMPLE_ID=MMETSP1096 /ASSEMBLY_ACC=CAM_ASM_000453 /LENGTH=130 /DNA_ID=CAMNT_0023308655 /DNA_START=152 /DNA_END=543 /DNA_ORIENTATION=-
MQLVRTPLQREGCGARQQPSHGVQLSMSRLVIVVIVVIVIIIILVPGLRAAACGPQDSRREDEAHHKADCRIPPRVVPQLKVGEVLLELAGTIGKAPAPLPAPRWFNGAHSEIMAGYVAQVAKATEAGAD